MRRLIYRSLDLRSRVHELTQAEIDACFEEVGRTGEPRVLSYFSHDCRDMRPETYDICAMLAGAASRTGVPWLACTAVDAHQRYHGLEPDRVALEVEPQAGGVRLRTDRPPFQGTPFFAAELDDGRVVRLYPRRLADNDWLVAVDPGRLRRYGAAVTSEAGVKTVRLAA
jgi:hypothetical protein